MGCLRICLLLSGLFSVYTNYSPAQSNLKYYVSGIQISGNTSTKEFIILRELTYKQGDSLVIDSLNPTIARSRNNLLNTSLFNFVTINYTITERNIQFLIDVEERWYLWPYPIFEQADMNLASYFHNQEWNRLNYGFHLVKYNFRGRKEVLKVKIRLGFKEQYSVLYDVPFFDKAKKFGFLMDISWFRQKKMIYDILNDKPKYFESNKNYLRKEFRSLFTLKYRPGLYHFYNIEAGYGLIRIHDSIADLNSEYLGKEKTLAQSTFLGIDYSFDNRDSWVYPLQGFLFNISLQYKWITEVKSYPIIKIKTNYNLKLANRLYWASLISAANAGNSSLPFNYALYLGYDEYVRGFEYYLINGNRYILFKNNIRYQLIKPRILFIQQVDLPKFNKIQYALYLNAYVDCGYAESKNNINQNNYVNNELFSVGLGFDLVTYYDKVVRIEYTANNFGFKALYIHLTSGF